MKTKNLQQEILLFTSSTFSQKEWCLKDASDKQSFFQFREQLENACWNGLLEQMFPELLGWGRQLFLWHVYAGKSFLSIELSEGSQTLERKCSIDPYLFIVSKNIN